MGTDRVKPMTDPAPLDPQALLEQAPWLRRLARELVTDAASADDLLQDAWVAWLERTRPVDDPPGWFAGTLRNLARHRHRGRARRAVREQAAARHEREPDTSDLVERANLHGALVQAVTGLREPYRATLLLRYLEELPPRAIAKREGVSVNTVNTRLARGLRELRDRLDASRGGREGWLPALAGWAFPTATTLIPAGALTMSTFTKSVAAATAACALGVGGWWALDRSEPVEPHALEVAEVEGLERDERSESSDADTGPVSAPAMAPRTSLTGDAPEPTTADATLLVRVLSSATGEPLENASVGCATEDLVAPGTDSLRVFRPTVADGTLELRVLPDRPLTVSAKGSFALEAGSVDVLVEPLGPGESRALDVVLPHGLDRTWFGRVVAQDTGLPIGGASVELEDARTWRNDASEPLATSQSRADGTFEIDVPSWKPSIARVEATGRAPALVGLVLDHDQPGSEQEIELPAAARLEIAVLGGTLRPEETTARVRAEAYRWIANDAVTFPLAWKPDPAWTSPIAVREATVFAELPVGVPLELDLVRDGEVAVAHPEPIVLEPGVTRRVELTTAGLARLTGRAVDESGAPAADLELWLIPADGPRRRLFSPFDREAVHATTRTDASGSFAFESVADGHWWVGPGPQKSGNLLQTLPADGVAPAAEPVHVELGVAEPLELIVQRGLAITGTVVDAQDEPVSGAQVFATSPTHGPGWMSITRADGTFVLGSLVAGEHMLSAMHGGAASESVFATAGDTDVVIAYPPSGAIEGTFHGLPADVLGRVLLITPSGSGAEPERELPRSELRFLQYQGETGYRCERLAPGRYDVAARAGSGWAAVLEGVEVRAGETTGDADLHFATGATLAITAEVDEPFVRVDAIQGEGLVSVDWAEPSKELRVTLPAERTTLVLRGPSGRVLGEQVLHPKPGEMLELALPR